MQSFIMNSHEVFIHIHQGCFAGTGAIVRLPQCQWSKPDGYGKISQCITTTKHSKAKTVCIFLGIYCMYRIPSLSETIIILIYMEETRDPVSMHCHQGKRQLWANCFMTSVGGFVLITSESQRHLSTPTAGATSLTFRPRRIKKSTGTNWTVSHINML